MYPLIAASINISISLGDYQQNDVILSHICLLPPCRIIGQLRILRQTLTFNFSQENIKYII
jgi:hypothetical protein